MTLSRRGLLWAIAALLGLAVTVALTWSVSVLAGQHIGLSSAPPSVIQGLAPPAPKPADGGADEQPTSTVVLHPRPARPARATGSTTSRKATPSPAAAASETTVGPPPGPAVPSGGSLAPSSTAVAPTTATSTGRSSQAGGGGGDRHDDSGGGGGAGSGGGSGRDD
jgi:hypothetical protein